MNSLDSPGTSRIKGGLVSVAAPDGLACGEFGIKELHKDAYSAAKAAAQSCGDGTAGHHLCTFQQLTQLFFHNTCRFQLDGDQLLDHKLSIVL